MAICMVMKMMNILFLLSALYSGAAFSGERTVKKIDLPGEGSGLVKIAVSFPSEYETRGGPFSVVLVLPGLGYGRDSLRLLKDGGPNVLVAFEYPFNGANNPKDLIEGITKTPDQIVTALKWISAQSWANQK